MTWNKCPLHAALPVALGLNGDADGVQGEPHLRRAAPRSAADGTLAADIISEAEFRDAPKMNWVKALLLLSCLIVECADLVTTNVILDHGLPS